MLYFKYKKYFFIFELVHSFLPSLFVPIVGFLTPLLIIIGFLLFADRDLID